MFGEYLINWQNAFFKKETFKKGFPLKILFFIQKSSAVKTTYFLLFIILLN